MLAVAAAGSVAVAPGPAHAAEDATADRVAEAYAVLLERDYLYPDTGKRYAAAIRASIAAGRYKGLSGEALGTAIDRDIDAVSPDGHLRLRIPEAVPGAAASPGAASVWSSNWR